MWALIKKTISDKWNEIINDVTNLPAYFQQIGGQIIDSLKNGILEKWESLKAQFAEIKKWPLTSYRIGCCRMKLKIYAR